MGAADSALAAYRYDAAVAVEAETGDSLLIVAERLPVARGWGTCVRRLVPGARDYVHVNHPHFDLDSEWVGLRLYRECRCRWLHLELARPLRADSASRRRVAEVVGAWMRRQEQDEGRGS